MIKNVVLGCVLLVFTSSMYAQYRTIEKKDANGYTYEIVENDPSHTRVYTLKNGLKVYLAQNKDKPLIQTYIPVRAGSNSDPSDNTGLAHYLEHMLFKGTSNLGTVNWDIEQQYIAQISDLYEKHKASNDVVQKDALYKQIDSLSKVASQYAVANEYDKSVASIGAVATNAHTWFEETVYQNIIPSNEIEKFLMIESERFSELVLRLFHTELEAVYEEFNRSQDNDRRSSMQAMLSMLFPQSNYGQQTTIGTSEHLKNPSMLAINDYFNTYYVANNMAVVMVGDLEFASTISLIDKYFGDFRSSSELPQYVAQEVPLTKIQETVIYSPESARVEIGFRFDGAKSKDALYLTLIDLLLYNGQAGLIDLDINQKQKALYAGGYTMIMKDYSVHLFSGMPNQGQTIEQVKDLLLQQVEKVKRGEFEPWLLQAVVNELKVDVMKALESNTQMGGAMYDAFIKGRSWQDVVEDLDKMSSITKEDLVQFAKDNYKDNYAVVYKEQGEKKDLVHVENPGITPIDLNRESESQFFKELQQVKVKPIEPVFIDFKKEIQSQKIGQNQTVLYSIDNTTNALGSITYIFDLGSDNDKKVGLAFGYLDYLGTDQYSAADIKKEFYKLGIDYSFRSGQDQTFITISGLNENLDKGVVLLEEFLTNVVVNREAYGNLVDQILKSRQDNKLNKNAIMSALNAYVTSSGEKSRFTDVLSKEELLQINPEELVDILKGFFDYNQEVFYYGNDLANVSDALVKYHNLGKDKPVASPVIYAEPASSSKVYFAPYDMVQAEISFRSRESLFNKDLLATSGVFNNYFGGGMASVVFQEIRESKSLAYSAYAGYSNAVKQGRYNYVSAYVGTQANKLAQAVDAMMELMNNMPQADNQFESAKNLTLKNIATLRYTKSSIFYYWLSLKKRGIDYDINKDIYAQTKQMTMTQLVDFFDKHVKSKTYNVGLLGKKEALDWSSVQKLGQVKEVTLEEIFGY